MLRIPLTIRTQLRAPSPLSFCLIQGLIDVIASGAQGEVGKRLRIVAERFAGRTDFFSIQPYMVAISEHLLVQQARCIQATCTRQALCQSETTGTEGAFITSNTVIRRLHRIIAKDKRIVD
jgi:hypothetical protein